MQKLFDVYVARVVLDIKDGHFVWYPTVHKSILVNIDGRINVIYSEKDQHIVSKNCNDWFDNYDQAFAKAKAMLSYMKTDDFCQQEERFLGLSHWLIRDGILKPDYNDKREVVFSDLAKDKKQ